MKIDVQYLDTQGSTVPFDANVAKLVIYAWDGFRDVRLQFTYPIKGRKKICGSVGTPWNSDFTFAGSLTALKKHMKEASDCHAAINDERFVLF